MNFTIDRLSTPRSTCTTVKELFTRHDDVVDARELHHYKSTIYSYTLQDYIGEHISGSITQHHCHPSSSVTSGFLHLSLHLHMSVYQRSCMPFAGAGLTDTSSRAATAYQLQQLIWYWIPVHPLDFTVGSTSDAPPMTTGVRNIRFGLTTQFPDSSLVGSALAVLKESILSGR